MGAFITDEELSELESLASQITKDAPLTMANWALLNAAPKLLAEIRHHRDIADDIHKCEACDARVQGEDAHTAGEEGGYLCTPCRDELVAEERAQVSP